MIGLEQGIIQEILTVLFADYLGLELETSLFRIAELILLNDLNLLGAVARVEIHVAKVVGHFLEFFQIKKVEAFFRRGWPRHFALTDVYDVRDESDYVAYLL